MYGCNGTQQQLSLFHAYNNARAKNERYEDTHHPLKIIFVVAQCLPCIISAPEFSALLGKPRCMLFPPSCPRSSSLVLTYPGCIPRDASWIAHCVPSLQTCIRVRTRFRYANPAARSSELVVLPLGFGMGILPFHEGSRSICSTPWSAMVNPIVAISWLAMRSMHMDWTYAMGTMHGQRNRGFPDPSGCRFLLPHVCIFRCMELTCSSFGVHPACHHPSGGVAIALARIGVVPSHASQRETRVCDAFLLHPFPTRVRIVLPSSVRICSSCHVWSSLTPPCSSSSFLRRGRLRNPIRCRFRRSARILSPW